MIRLPLTEIGVRATTLWERAEMQEPPCPTHPDIVEARLSRWRHVVAGNDARRFRRYLRWSNLNDKGARRAVALPRVRPDRSPEWLTIVELACRNAVEDGDAMAEGQGLRPELASQQPFAELMLPFVTAARRRLVAAAGRHYAELTQPAHSELEAALLMRLARLADRAFFVEFAAFRSHGGASPDMWPTFLALLFEPAATGMYRAFVRQVLASGFAGVFHRYPVLARLMAVCAQVWVGATAEWLAALVADRRPLEATFGHGVPLGPIVHVTPHLSDPHRGGRTVCRVRFASGLQLVYKPHSTGPEATFRSLLDWLNDRQVSLPLEAPATLDCGTHGWTEAVVPRACASATELAAYEQRAGMLLCLTYVLGSSDLHGANLISSGEFPVLVDLEVLMSARPRVASPDGDCVLRTGLLPAAHIGRDGIGYRGGALIPADPPSRRRQWRHVNTDRMARDDLETTVESALARRPTCDSTAPERTAHGGDIEAGFRDMFRVLRRQRGQLALPGGPLAPARHQRYRVILRSTAVYASLLDRTLHPAQLGDGADWSIELERLKAAATHATSRPPLWPALVAERVALERLDIPVFEADGTGTALHTFERAPVPHFSSETAYGATLRRLARLDDDELTAQTQLIRVALTLGDGNGEPRRPCDAAGAAHDRYVSAALEIGRRLQAASFESRTGEINWIGATRARGRSRRDVAALGWDLFGGRAGVALFFAAVGAVTGNPGAKTLACHILQPLVRPKQGECREPWRRRLGVIGRGGIIYALARVGQLAESPSLVDAAAHLARGITPRMIDRDRELDVVLGSAGGLLGLLALHDVTADRQVLDRAELCGRHVLTAARNGCTQHGFAHGWAGIAYSVARLYRKTGNALYRDFAIRSLERYAAGVTSIRSRAHEHRGRTQMLRHSWCRGSSGIALSSIACSILMDAPHLRTDLDRLVDEVLRDRAPISDVDHACCGHTGRICLLSTAARTLSRPGWMSAAAAALDRMIDRRSHRTIYTLGVSDDVLAPGFFQGLAGIGYELLRFRSDTLPTVLLLE